MFTIATRSNAELIEANYRKWKDEPHSVNETWRAYFEGFELGLTEPPANRGKQGAQGEASASKQMNVSSLIYRYRSIGHTQANLDPLSSAPPSNPDLDLEQFDLDEKRILYVSAVDYGTHQRASLTVRPSKDNVLEGVEQLNLS